MKQKSVVIVSEVGTADPWTALYVDNLLITISLTKRETDIIYALGVKVSYKYVSKGYDGNFPPILTAIKGLKA